MITQLVNGRDRIFFQSGSVTLEPVLSPLSCAVSQRKHHTNANYYCYLYDEIAVIFYSLENSSLFPYFIL